LVRLSIGPLDVANLCLELGERAIEKDGIQKRASLVLRLRCDENSKTPHDRVWRENHILRWIRLDERAKDFVAQPAPAFPRYLPSGQKSVASFGVVAPLSEGCPVGTAILSAVAAVGECVALVDEVEPDAMGCVFGCEAVGDGAVRGALEAQLASTMAADTRPIDAFTS
jgi:hypothetical protein